MSDFKDQFLAALTRGYRAYKEHGSRSNKKLIPIHACIARYVQENLGERYAVKSYGIGDGREHTAPGRYYAKQVDIAVLDGSGKTVCAVAFKFVTSNYKQNNINYFESMMGETANLRRQGCGVVHIIVLPRIVPYRTKGGDVSKAEELSEQNLEKYIKLYDDMDFPHKPDLFYVVIVEIDGDSVKYCPPDRLPFGRPLKDKLFADLSIAGFERKFFHLCKLKSDE